MKTYIPTISLIASLAFASSNSSAQNPTPKPVPGTPAAPRAAVVAVTPDEEATATVEAALAAQDAALEAQNETLAKVDENLRTLTSRAGRATASTRTLVIPKDAADAKSLSDTEEDMSVMARILEKAASGKSDKGERPSTFVWGFAGSSGTPKNLYIDGYGALFFINVSFPLLPPATKEQASEPKSETPSEWETTRNELFHPPGKSTDYSYNFELFDFAGPFATSGPAEEYDEEKVTDLKENLTAALKNASHIRRLKGDDTVTVVVAGRGPRSGPKVATRRLHTGPSAANSSSSSGSWSVLSSSSSGSSTQAPAARLIIRAKRSDIESFQKDKLSADDFRKKVTMFIY